jgi:(p)ppGpp synthase/HD superfamily hydrolase
MTKILDAENFAREKHKHQTRNDPDIPYSNHLEKVVEILKNLGITDETILAAGWLHDTIEDTDTDYDDIHDEIDKETADIVSTMTKDTRMIRNKREVVYCTQLKEGTWQAQIVKFADILANLEDLECWNDISDSERKEKARDKLEFYDAIKTGLKNNEKNIPNLNSETSRLSKGFLKYGIKIT